jgi:hypothetical protein
LGKNLEMTPKASPDFLGVRGLQRSRFGVRFVAGNGLAKNLQIA